MNQYEMNARRCLNILDQIDHLLVKLDTYDPYGDLVKNFIDWDDSTLVTKRLRKLIKDDLKEGYWKTPRD